MEGWVPANRAGTAAAAAANDAVAPDASSDQKDDAGE
jgi:hypothetical protein